MIIGGEECVFWEGGRKDILDVLFGVYVVMTDFALIRASRNGPALVWVSMSVCKTGGFTPDAEMRICAKRWKGEKHTVD
jgi:hypothetical protein